jgi:hypothetical protein
MFPFKPTLLYGHMGFLPGIIFLVLIHYSLKNFKIMANQNDDKNQGGNQGGGQGGNQGGGQGGNQGGGQGGNQGGGQGGNQGGGQGGNEGGGGSR